MSESKCPYAEKREVQFGLFDMLRKLDCFCTRQNKMVSSKKLKCFSPDHVKCKFYVPPPPTLVPVQPPQPAAPPSPPQPIATPEPRVERPPLPSPEPQPLSPTIPSVSAEVPVQQEQPQPPSKAGKTCNTCLLYSPSSGRCLKLMITVKDPNDPPCLKTETII
ncbi:MAG: hypothetical protein ACXQTI_08600 [Candidatus Nezhaarchaeales archaeon]